MHVRTGERPTALLNENSGASHGQNAVPQANPSPMKRSGREPRRGAGGSAHSIGASSLTGEVLSSCRTNTTCPKSGPSRGIATGSPVGVCHVPMKRVRLERTPKPTNPYSNALQVPEKITCYQDIADFLNQFPQSEYYKPVTESEGLPA